MHGMANRMRCNLSILTETGIPDKQIRLKLFIYPAKLNVVKHGKDMAWVCYTNLNGAKAHNR
jgi:hypothetical protein